MIKRTLQPRRWQNRAGNVGCQPSHCAYPATLEEVQSELKRCSEEAERLRIVGRGHAYTPLNFSDENHMSLAHFTGVESVDKPRKRAWIRAGTRMIRLGQALAQRGLAMDIHSDHDQQTVGGAFAGGMINSANGFASLASLVTGYRIVLPNGAAHLVTAADGENFDAGRLSLGVLGVVTHVEVQCRTPYRLETRREMLRFSEVLPKLERLRRAHRHFTVYWYPHSGDALLLTRDITRSAVSVLPCPRRFQGFLTDNLIGLGLDHTTRLAPVLGAMAQRINRLSGRRRSWVTDAHAAYGRIRWSKQVESEYAIRVEDAPQALQRLERLIKTLNVKVTLPITVRFAPAEQAWLSPAYQRDVALIGIRAPDFERYQEYFAALWDALDRYDARPHWCKLHNKTAHELRQLYPRFDDFTALRGRVDPRGMLMNRYLDRLLGVAS